MLIIAMICIFVATILFVIAGLLTKRPALSHFFRLLSMLTMILLGMTCATYGGKFNGYTIAIIFSVVFMMLSTRSFNLHILGKEIQRDDSKSVDIAPPQKNKFVSYLSTTRIDPMFAIGSLLGAICIGVAGVYIGLENYYGFLLGLAIAVALTTATMLVKKQTNPCDVLIYFILFFVIGLMLGQGIEVILYNSSASNIFYFLGCVVSMVYFASYMVTKKEIIHVAYYIATALFFTTFFI